MTSTATTSPLYALTVDATGAAILREALTAAADQRTRTATAAAGTLDRERRGGNDVRPRAVRLVTLLAEADQLRSYADQLETPVPVAELTEAAPDTRNEHERAYDDAADAIGSGRSAAATSGETGPLCLHEEWETDDLGKPVRCSDCGEALPENWTGPQEDRTT